MRGSLAAVMIGIFLLAGSMPAAAASRGPHVVTGVGEGDMLKLRAGPGLGYVIIVGLPNGAEVHVHGCERIGGTRWCDVSLASVRALRGYVADDYLMAK